MFAQQMGTTEAPKPARKKRENTEGELNLESMMNLASGLLGNQNPGAGGRQNAEGGLDLNSMMNLASGLLGNQNGAAGFMPAIMSALSSFSDTEAQKRADDHKDHASFLPPMLEKAHLYWDIFINSELGKTIWEKSGLKRTLKAFTGPDGKISFQQMFKNFENHSFRRHWIKAAAKYLTDMVVHVAKPEVYSR